MEITADRRRLTVAPSPERMRDAQRTAALYLDARLAMAKALAALQESGAHRLDGWSSLHDYATQALRLPGTEVRNLLDLGRALGLAAAPEIEPADANDESDDGLFGGCGSGGAQERADRTGQEPTPSTPTIEDHVRNGSIQVDNATQLSRLRRELGGLSAEEHAYWARLARVTPTWKFRQLVAKAIEDFRQGRPTRRFEAHVTESALDDFRRAKVIAQRRAKRTLTDGQTFALLARRFVEAEDERYVGEKKRRVGDTRRLPGERYVPAAVKRAVRARSKDRCEVGDCSNDTFLELMHVRTPHAKGGAREVDDLADGCTSHHTQLDAGVIHFVGFDSWQRPVFRSRGGRLIAKPPPDE